MSSWVLIGLLEALKCGLEHVLQFSPKSLALPAAPVVGSLPDLRLPLTSEGWSKHSTSVQPLVSRCLKVKHL